MTITHNGIDYVFSIYNDSRWDRGFKIRDLNCHVDGVLFCSLGYGMDEEKDNFAFSEIHGPKQAGRLADRFPAEDREFWLGKAPELLALVQDGA